eukprot:scaffold15763_cov128-Isochrysis_galbana.AAC.1
MSPPVAVTRVSPGNLPDSPTCGTGEGGGDVGGREGGGGGGGGGENSNDTMNVSTVVRRTASTIRTHRGCTG